MVNIEERLVKELGIKLVQVQNVIKLLDEGWYWRDKTQSSCAASIVLINENVWSE